MTFTEFMGHVAQGFEALGVLVLAVGTLWSFLVSGSAWYRSGRPRQAYALIRETLGRTLLLGLEILVAADLVRTVAVDPTLSNLLGLGLIVLIRTFLSFSLETEITGWPPWRGTQVSGAKAISGASVNIANPKSADETDSG